MSVRTLRSWRLAVLPFAFVATAATAGAQANVTSPKAFFGHNIGDDYWLPNYDQFQAYWHKLDAESDRMKVIDMGKTSEGRPQLAAIITAPENFKNLERYRQISLQLASGKGLTDAQARALSREGKAVVWIDGGLHATEVLGANQLIETTYQLVSRTDDENNRVLRDDIILMVHANPDGMQLVANWYMQEKDSLERNMNIPVLYNKYAGHDDNRDLYMSNLAESKNINHLMFWDWHPVIMYDHHQTGPAGTVMFSPPFRDPFNYKFDPMLVMGLDMVGAAIHTRLLQEDKPGFTMRSGSSYSTWWNGGLRTIGYFQNIIGILTETIGNPTPETIPFIPAQQLPHGDLPAPIAPQVWHFRQSIDYEVAANYSIFDLASRYKDELLYDKWHMAHDQVQNGSTDHWTVNTDVVDAANDALEAAAGTRQEGAPSGGRGFGRPRVDAATAMKVYKQVMRNPATRDPRGFIIPSDQADFPTATKLVNTLRNLGIVVDRATSGFTVAGKQYPAGSYVVKTDQEGRAQVLDTFEPQHYPNDFAYPGGPPVRPYDNAGWTLAYTMGVKFDRVLDGFDGPFQPIDGLATVPAGTIASASGAKGYLMSHEENDAFTVVNRVLASGGSVYWLESPITAGGVTYPVGTFYVPAQSLPIIRTAAAELGVSFTGVPTAPPADARPLDKQRVALYDQYGGSMPSGWTRYELEAFEFPYKLVYPQDLDAGNLKSKFDVLILPSGASIRGGGAAGGRGGRGGRTADVPEQYQHMLGSMSTDKTLPQLKQFLEQGGTIITVGSASSLGYQLGLPLENYLTQRNPGEAPKPLTGEQYYIPGSVLSVAVDTTQPAAAGMSAHTDVFFENSPVFRLGPDAALRGVHPIAWFDTTTPLRSGWAWGQNYLDGGTTAVEADIGKGHLYLYGPEITFRGQPHGTFKFLFNGIYAPSKTPDVVP
jgi:hypothetical protein